VNIIQKLVKKKQSAAEAARVEQIQNAASQLWALLRETIEYYNSIACPCAFPRFRQYIRIDCLDTHGSFYMSETEGLIHTSKDCFTVEQIDKGSEIYQALCTCKKCGSTYITGWSDFSIHVNRTFLKPIEIKTAQKGADAETPIPFVVGLFGHKLPDLAGFKHVGFEEFKEYVQALK
jgi:hypothetical protein